MSDFFFRMKEKDPTIIRKEHPPPQKKITIQLFTLFVVNKQNTKSHFS